MVRYSPVVLFTYKRLDLLKRVLSSLEKNEETLDTDLFIYADLNDKEEDSEKVRLVREFINKYSIDSHAFKTITVIPAKEHKGLANSVISGVSNVIKRFGKVIVLEDDLIVSRFFLKYMNQCLDYYERDDRIWSVNGYSPYVRAKKKYDKAVYLDYRAVSWGWGTWKDRWEMVDWSIPDYSSFVWNIVAKRKFCRGGNDLTGMLRAQMRGKIDSWAIRWCYYESRYDKYSVAPTESLVANDGFDEEATNCNNDSIKKFAISEFANRSCEWRIDDLRVDKDICRDLYRLYSVSIAIRIRDKYREIRKWFSGGNKK